MWSLLRVCPMLLFLLLGLTNVAQAAKNYTFEDLEPCGLSTVEIAQLGPGDELEPCIIFEVKPNSFVPRLENSSSVIAMVQVTPSNCGNHRDGTVTGVQSLNADNGGMGVAIGFQQDFYVNFRMVSVIAGNPASLSEGEYDRRHIQLLKSGVTALNAPYIVGSCSFASAIEKDAARDVKALVMAQVGPPGFYTDKNPYVFGFHINSDTYPLPNVQALAFMAKGREGGPSSIPVRVIYRTKSEFFYSTCRSAIDKLKSEGFTDLKEIIYDHAADHDGDGDTNQFDEDFLQGLADEACPPDTDTPEDFHPALFACTLTEQDIIIQRWVENGCRPASTWVTASTWNWANLNPGIVPYYQGGAQWHPEFSYSDRYFERGRDLLIHNEQKFGYLGTYDQLVSYAIPVLYAQHLISHYRVVDNPNPIADFENLETRELLRRSMLVLNADTLFGPVAFNEFQRNIGRGAAGTQWLPLSADGSFENALVSPFLQAEANTFIPALSALPCEAGNFVNETARSEDGAVLASGCARCPVDTFTLTASQVTECTPCPGKSTTEGMEGQAQCIIFEENLLPAGILAFGYTAVGITWCLSAFFISWLVYHRKDAVVKVSQIEFLVLICVGAMISSSTIIALSFQAGIDEDTSTATAGCTAAPFLYAVGWVLQYSSLSAKTFRLYIIMQNNNSMKRVVVTAFKMFRIVVIALAIDLVILISWTIKSPLVYERSEENTSIDEETGVLTISTSGRCTSSDEDFSFWVFAGPLVGFHVFLVLSTNILLYSVRHIADRYQEQKYVAMASMLMFEILIVGIPVMIAVNDSPEATFLVLTGIIALDDIGILCFIFGPKILYQRKGLEEGVGFGESVMRDTYKRASMRESQRRDSSSSFEQGAGQNFAVPSQSSDSFVMRLSGERPSSPREPSPRFESVDELRSGISVSIIEETSEELKNMESDDSSAGMNQISEEDSTSEQLRAKKRELEQQLSERSAEQKDSKAVSPPASPNSLSEANEKNETIAEHARMVEMAKTLMEDHERMMKATAEIMSEHQRLKDRLGETHGASTPEDGQSNQEPQKVEQEQAAAPLSEYQQTKRRLSASSALSQGAEEAKAVVSTEEVSVVEKPNSMTRRRSEVTVTTEEGSDTSIQRENSPEH